MPVGQSDVIRILIGILVAAAVTIIVMAWAIHHRGQKIDTLSERNDRLNSLVDMLNRANHDLANQVQDMADRHRRALTLVSQAESDKRRMAAELESRNADLRRALRNQPDWAETPVPGPVADGVNVALDRLRDTASGGGYQL